MAVGDDVTKGKLCLAISVLAFLAFPPKMAQAQCAFDHVCEGARAVRSRSRALPAGFAVNLEHAPPQVRDTFAGAVDPSAGMDFAAETRRISSARAAAEEGPKGQLANLLQQGGRRLVLTVSPPLCIETSGTPSVTVSSQAELNAALANAPCGTDIILQAGTYSTGIRVDKSCDAGNPIVIRNAAGATPHINGDVTLRGSHTYLSGLHMNSAIRLYGDGHRLTRNVMQGKGSGTLVIRSNGTNMIIDHNEIYHYGQGIRVCSTMSCGGAESNRGTYIGYNYFHDQEGERKNANESITTHGHAWGRSQLTIEYNLIVDSRLDDEAISIKTSDNVIRGNTIVNSKGLVVRMGSNNLLEGNTIINGKGIRIHGDNNVLDNNLIDDNVGIRIAEGSITLDDRNPQCHTGDIQPIKLLPDGQCEKGHPAARNTVVTNNYSKITVGCLSSKPNYNIPAQNTKLSNNHGSVSTCRHSGTSSFGGAPTKPPPRRLTPSDVGPEADAASCSF